MKKKFWTLFLCIVAFCLVGWKSVSVSADTDETKELTIMLYVCGSNLESDNGSASRDINEIIKTRFNREDINVIAMLGGSTKWWGKFALNETAVYDLGGKRPEKVYANGLLGMGKAETLTTFLDYGYEAYPAKKYALVIWDHGGGPLGGMCWDYLDRFDNMSFDELQAALQESRVAEIPLEWIGFDACLMASAETACMLAPYAHYMIASEETEPSLGWNYKFLRELTTDFDGASIGKHIIDYYAQSVENVGNTTLSCLDLTKKDELLNAMNGFFSGIVRNITEDTFPDISVLRQETRSFGRAEEISQDYDLVDLKDLIYRYEAWNPEAAKNLFSVLDQMIIYNYCSIENCHGLSIYHPYYNKKSYQSSWKDLYSQIEFSSAYRNYLRRFTTLWLGEKLTDWEEIVTEEAEQNTSASEDSLTFEVSLTDEQAAQCLNAQMVVLEEQNDTYSPVYMTDEVELTEDGVLTAEYTMDSLYAVDSKGEILAGPLSYVIQDGEYLIQAVYFSIQTATVINVQYHCMLDPDTRELLISSIWVYDDASQTYTPRLDSTEYDSDCIFFPKYFRKVTYDEALVAYQEWEFSEYSMKESILKTKDWHFELKKMELESNLYVTFQVTDAQVNTVSSEPIQIEAGE